VGQTGEAAEGIDRLVQALDRLVIFVEEVTGVLCAHPAQLSDGTRVDDEGRGGIQ
jgi:hypothetical protein